MWHYQGSPIGRTPIVRLFARALKRDEAGDYWLETPVERGRIQVDDAPFLAVDVTVTGSGTAQRLEFRTNLDEIVTADEAHPIHLRPQPPGSHPDLGPRPYILLHDRIEALIARPVYYRLVELASEQAVGGVPLLGVWSCGVFFPLTAEPIPSGQADGSS